MKKKLKIGMILLCPITFMLNIISKYFPEFVERYYSTGINKTTIQGISLSTGSLPFSAAEFLVFLLLIVSIALFILMIVSFKKKKPMQGLINFFAYASALYVLFMLLWGFNYNRLSFDKIAGLEIEKSSTKELYDLCEDLIRRANVLGEAVDRNSQGIMYIRDGYKGVFKRAQKGYAKASEVYPELSGRYGIPKRILLSSKMSYTGITGIYVPYTGEANVNVNITDFTLPSTAAHEMAHQRGFAREDEANYIAYLTCIMHPDKDFQYSGTMLALTYSMNSLAKSDREGYKVLRAKYSENVRKDLAYDVQFWEKYEGRIQEISDNINSTYLKSNGQKDGVRSYGRMVDLLLAEYKKSFPRQ